MSPKLLIVEVIAVLAGAVIGTIVASFVYWLFLDGSFALGAATLGPYVLALVTVAIFAVLYNRLPATPAVLASLAAGILLPAVVVRFAADLALGWGALLFLSLVFALVSLSVYRFVHASGRVRAAARGVTDRP